MKNISDLFILENVIKQMESLSNLFTRRKGTTNLKKVHLPCGDHNRVQTPGLVGNQLMVYSQIQIQANM